MATFTELCLLQPTTSAHPVTFLHFVFGRQPLCAVCRFPGAAQPHEGKTSDTGTRTAIVRARQGNRSRECLEMVGIYITELPKLVKHGPLYSLSDTSMWKSPVATFAPTRGFGIPPVDTSAPFSNNLHGTMLTFNP